MSIIIHISIIFLAENTLIFVMFTKKNNNCWFKNSDFLTGSCIAGSSAKRENVLCTEKRWQLKNNYQPSIEDILVSWYRATSSEVSMAAFTYNLQTELPKEHILMP